MKKQISTIIFILFIVISLQAQITRGFFSGEIYIPSVWYYQGGQNNFDAIFYSEDNGETLEIKYIFNLGSTDMPIGSLISDANEGVIYNNNDALWRSNDYGNNWIFVEDVGTDKRYTSGCSEGEIYKYCKNPTSMLYRSSDYGQNFEEINQGVFGFPEVGTQLGELYILTGSTWPSFFIELLRSSNYGGDFETIEIDTSFQGYYLSGNFPEISRGSDPGEFYLITWHLPANYHVYYSNDYCQSFELKFISEECDFYFENYSFTAGKESGEFYVVKQIPWYDGINTELYIYHSNDTAQTFTEFYHILDENFPVSIIETEKAYEAKIEISPNPFRDNVRIESSIQNNAKFSSIIIRDMFGKTIREFPFDNKKIVFWDGTDVNGSKVMEGVYFCNLIVNNTLISNSKIIYVK